jgi:hypothetical protein
VSNLLTTTNSSGSTFQITDISNNNITDTMVANGAQYVSNLLNLKTTFQYILEDFINAKWLIVTLLSIAAVVSFFYILIMRWLIGNIYQKL